MKKKKTKPVPIKEMDLRGIFTIVKGQYHVSKPLPGKDYSIEGYNPDSSTTNEWYQVKDHITWYTVYAGASYDGALKALEGTIRHYKNQRKYFRHVCDVTSEDYYEVHYLGHKPLTHDQLVAKVEGRCPRVSPSMKNMYNDIYTNFHHHYASIIEKIEDSVYENPDPVLPKPKTVARCSPKDSTNTIEVKKPKLGVISKNPENTKPKLASLGVRCKPDEKVGGPKKLKLKK